MGANIYKNKKPLLVFLLPALIFMVLYLYYPFFMNIVNSFRNIKMLGTNGDRWNDPLFTNYIELFRDENVWTSLKNTLIMTAIITIRTSIECHKLCDYLLNIGNKL